MEKKNKRKWATSITPLLHGQGLQTDSGTAGLVTTCNGTSPRVCFSLGKVPPYILLTNEGVLQRVENLTVIDYSPQVHCSKEKSKSPALNVHA
jgi:hypothetical protein